MQEVWWHAAARGAASSACSPEVGHIYPAGSVAKKLGGGEVEEVEAGSVDGASPLTQGGISACVCIHRQLSGKCVPGSGSDGAGSMAAHHVLVGLQLGPMLAS